MEWWSCCPIVSSADWRWKDLHNVRRPAPLSAPWPYPASHPSCFPRDRHACWQDVHSACEFVIVQLGSLEELTSGNRIDLRDLSLLIFKVSYLELYNDQMYDLLSENPGDSDSLAVLEDANGGTYVRVVNHWSPLTIDLITLRDMCLEQLFWAESVYKPFPETFRSAGYQRSRWPQRRRPSCNTLQVTRAVVLPVMCSTHTAADLTAYSRCIWRSAQVRQQVSVRFSLSWTWSTWQEAVSPWIVGTPLPREYTYNISWSSGEGTCVNYVGHANELKLLFSSSFIHITCYIDRAHEEDRS